MKTFRKIAPWVAVVFLVVFVGLIARESRRIGTYENVLNETKTYTIISGDKTFIVEGNADKALVLEQLDFSHWKRLLIGDTSDLSSVTVICGALEIEVYQGENLTSVTQDGVRRLYVTDKELSERLLNIVGIGTK